MPPKARRSQPKHVRKSHLCTSTKADPPIFPETSWKKLKYLSPSGRAQLVNEATEALKQVKEFTGEVCGGLRQKKLFEGGGSEAGPSSSMQCATSSPKKRKHPKSFVSSPDPLPLPPNDQRRDGLRPHTAVWPSREPSREPTPLKTKTNGKAKMA